MFDHRTATAAANAHGKSLKSLDYRDGGAGEWEDGQIEACFFNTDLPPPATGVLSRARHNSCWVIQENGPGTLRIA